MIRTWLLPLLALAGVALAAWTVKRTTKPAFAAPPVVEPARPPFPTAVAGSGMVEASSENIAVAAPVAGVCIEVSAKRGEPVAAGAPLFRLDDRAATAQVAAADADVAIKRAAVDRLVALPRPEDVPPAEAAARALLAEVDAAKDQLQRAEAMLPAKAIAVEEVTRRRLLLAAAQARAAESEARLAQLKAGAWAPELAEARAELQAAEARAAAARVELARLTITAPIAATVLAVSVHPGEFVPATPQETPPVLLGATDPLNVRIDVDETDAWRVRPGARAIATLRGNPRMSFPLTYVRTEPFVVPKRSLTGESTERVDTRVLQVVYRVDAADAPLHVGQLVDAYIDAPPPDGEAPPAR